MGKDVEGLPRLMKHSELQNEDLRAVLTFQDIFASLGTHGITGTRNKQSKGYNLFF